jgi:AraC-like DNA-binding protein
MSGTDVLLSERVVSWSSAEERRLRVEELHRRGVKITDIAKKLGCSRKTIQRDFIELGLEAFSTVGDEELSTIVFEIVQTMHKSVGVLSIEGALIDRGFRVQRRRIEEALVQQRRINILMINL